MRNNDYFKTEFVAKRAKWLEQVSRTFTLSINILPTDLKEFVGHAYLICRLLDTIEDAPNLTVKDKISYLELVITLLKQKNIVKEDCQQLVELAKTIKAKEAEIELLVNSLDIFNCLDQFPKEAKETVTRWAIEMAKGMQKYAFGEDRPFLQLESREQLEEYTYFVAGTVGKLLSELFLVKIGNISPEKREIIERNSIPFGKALQYVNILKDCRADILEGRCYLPKEEFDKRTVTLDDFINSTNSEKIKEIFIDLNQQAQSYLDNAIEYICAIPVKHWRIRLFCIWPVVLAYKTLGFTVNNLDSMLANNIKLKIARKQVKQSIKRSSLGAVSNSYLKLYLKYSKSFS